MELSPGTRQQYVKINRTSNYYRQSGQITLLNITIHMHVSGSSNAKILSPVYTTINIIWWLLKYLKSSNVKCIISNMASVLLYLANVRLQSFLSFPIKTTLKKNYLFPPCTLEMLLGIMLNHFPETTSEQLCNMLFCPHKPNTDYVRTLWTKSILHVISITLANKF